MAGVHKLSQTDNSLGANSVEQEDEDEMEQGQKNVEARLLVMALMDCNVPKLLADDISLFRGKSRLSPLLVANFLTPQYIAFTLIYCYLLSLTGIVKDIFPGVTIASAADSMLSNALHEATKENGFVLFPEFINKCLQLHATLLIRHGVMLVGETMSGKTACILPTRFF